MWITDPKWIESLRDLPLDLDSLLSRVVDDVAEALDAERATVFLLDRASGELVSRAGHLPEVAEIRIRVGEGVAGSVAARRRGTTWAARERGPGIVRRIDLETGFQTRSVLAVPLLDADEAVLGVLEAINKRGGDFSERDEAVATTLAVKLTEVLCATSLGAQLGPAQTVPLSFRFNGIVGESVAMRAVLERASLAAPTDATVLVTGETGTGKELLARALHVNSGRADGPMLTVDCAALPADLVENELFGHVRGAYTGADRAADGKVAAARGGTLFLDEIGELPLRSQGQLLRLLQERRYFPLGATTEREADVRIVAATHRDLRRAVAEGAFREDLWFRLRVVELELPPLRDRGHGEFDRLIDHFLHRAVLRYGRPGVRLSRAARTALHGYDWPGNVRELEHCVESAVVLCRGSVITREGLGELRPSTGVDAMTTPTGRASILPLREMERRYVVSAVESCDGNRSEAARLLGIGRNTLLRKLRGPSKV